MGKPQIPLHGAEACMHACMHGILASGCVLVGPLPMHSGSHDDAVVVVNLGAEGLRLRRAQRRDATKYLALLVNAHLDLIQAVLDAVAAKHFAQVFGAAHDRLRPAVWQRVVLKRQLVLHRRELVDLESNDIFLRFAWKHVQQCKPVRPIADAWRAGGDAVAPHVKTLEIDRGSRSGRPVARLAHLCKIHWSHARQVKCGGSLQHGQAEAQG